MTPHEIHNATAGTLVAAIVKPTMSAGGSSTEVLVLLESVIAGTILALYRIDAGEIVLDAVMEVVRDRVRDMMAKQRLSGLPPEGSA